MSTGCKYVDGSPISLRLLVVIEDLQEQENDGENDRSEERRRMREQFYDSMHRIRYSVGDNITAPLRHDAIV